MLSFKLFLKEKREKSDPHETTIRALASLGRMDHKYHRDMEYDNPDMHKDKKNMMTGRTHYGECDSVSHCVANRLRDTYPSVKVVYSKKFGQSYPSDPTGEEGLTGHSWVEIPETGHYIDPSHDMFRIKGSRTNITRKGGLFPNSAIKIGKIGDSYHQANYSTEPIEDKSWAPGLTFHKPLLPKQNNR